MPGLVQFLPAGHVGNLHIPRIDSSTENNGGTVCARSPNLKTPKLSCLPNDVNYKQIETKMAFRFTSGGVYDDLPLKWLNEHCSLSKDEKNDTFGEL